MARKAKQPQLPYQQLAIMSVCRFAEPVAATSVNPYIPEMIASFKVPTDQIGMYTGWLSGIFSLSQAITGIAWGRASDKVGRKPTILLALTIVMVSSVSFGFSTSLAMAFITRAAQGAASGNVGIIRTAVAEMVPEKELQPRAFSVMPLVWNVGSIFGPSLGGFLSNPRQRGWFMHSKLLARFPYGLPNLTISVLFLIGIITGLLFLKETHENLKDRTDYGLRLGALLTGSCTKRKRHYRKVSNDEVDPFLAESGSAMSSPVATKSPGQSIKPAKQTPWRDIFSRQSNINLIAYTGLAMHSVSFDQLLPVFMHHPVQSRKSSETNTSLRFSGGFGLDSGKIGILFTVYGIFGMLVQFFLFPPLAKRYGVLRCFKVCVITFPCIYLVIPFTSLLSTSSSRQGVCLMLMLIKCAAGIFAFPCSTILLTNSAASLSVLGTLNGVATSISAIGRATGPALCGWAFTLGVDMGYIVVPFWVLVTISIVAAIPVWSLVEMDGFGTKPSTAMDDDELDDEFDEQDRVRLEDIRTETVKKTSGLGILAGTETADLLEDEVPVTTQQTTKHDFDAEQHDNSSHTLLKVTSPIETGPSHTSSRLVRRVSTAGPSTQ